MGEGQHLPVGTGLRIEARGRDSVDLIDENDRRSVLLREAEDVAHEAGALTEVLLHKL